MEIWYNKKDNIDGFFLIVRLFKSKGSDIMLCHMRIDLGVILCARSGDWTILVQR